MEASLEEKLKGLSVEGAKVDAEEEGGSDDEEEDAGTPSLAAEGGAAGAAKKKKKKNKKKKKSKGLYRERCTAQELIVPIGLRSRR